MKTFILICALSLLAINLGVYHLAYAHASSTPAAAPPAGDPYRPLYALGVATGPSTSPVAAAGVAPDPGDDASGFFAWTFDAVKAKNGWLIASALVIGLTWLLRFLVRSKTSFLKWFATDRGGVVLTAIVATLCGFAHATAAGHAPSRALLLEVAEVWIGAIGMYVAARRALKPADQALGLSLGGGKGGGPP